MVSHDLLAVWVIMIAAICLDRVVKEPQQYHPLMFFGRWVNRIERRFNRSKDELPSCYIILFGAFAWLVAILPVLAIWSIFKLFLPDSVNNVFWLTLCLGYSSLIDHARQVVQASEISIEKSKEAVAMIVSRDSEYMNSTQIATATIESTLENGNDAVFATLFWFLCLGSFGALLHRLINTLDAMWGYKNERYLLFGRFAARADDVANWIPARITACMYALVGRTHSALRAWYTQAKRLSSPNGGVTMASGAAALDLRLGGPAYYHGERMEKPFFGGEREPDHRDIENAIVLLKRSVYLFVLISGSISIIIYIVNHV